MCAISAKQNIKFVSYLELELAWPNADFYYHNEGLEAHGCINDYLAGQCDVMVISYDYDSMDETLVDRLCKHDLVYTDSLAVQMRIAMPVRSELVQGFSYWMRAGEKLGLTFDSVMEDFKPVLKCDLQYGAEKQVNEVWVRFPLLKLIVFFILTRVFHHPYFHLDGLSGS